MLLRLILRDAASDALREDRRSEALSPIITANRSVFWRLVGRLRCHLTEPQPPHSQLKPQSFGRTSDKALTHIKARSSVLGDILISTDHHPS
jgi:hypothetical protein